MQGDENLVEFFEGRYSIQTLFNRLLKKEYVHLHGTFYSIRYNSHPECQRVKMELIKNSELKTTNFGNDSKNMYI